MNFSLYFLKEIFQNHNSNWFSFVLWGILTPTKGGLLLLSLVTGKSLWSLSGIRVFCTSTVINLFLHEYSTYRTSGITHRLLFLCTDWIIQKYFFFFCHIHDLCAKCAEIIDFTFTYSLFFESFYMALKTIPPILTPFTKCSVLVTIIFQYLPHFWLVLFLLKYDLYWDRSALQGLFLFYFHKAWFWIDRKEKERRYLILLSWSMTALCISV